MKGERGDREEEEREEIERRRKEERRGKGEISTGKKCNGS